VRVVGGFGNDGCLLALAQYLDRELRPESCELRLDVADREALADAMSIITRCCASNYTAVSIEKRLVAERIGVRDAMYFERDEPVRHAGSQLLLELCLADEVALVHAHEAVETGLERRVVRRHVATPH